MTGGRGGRRRGFGADEAGADPLSDTERALIESYPAWSKTLLLLLDYAIIEGVEHRLEIFVHLLQMARADLEAQITGTAGTAPN
jgi:hypothetical protein